MADIIPYGLSSPIGVPIPAGRWPLGVLLDRWDRSVSLAQVGGVGFEFQTGVIVVTALPDRVDVTTDRLIVYTGLYFGNGQGAPFDIAAPSLTADARTLQIPIVVATPGTPAFVAVAQGAGGNRSAPSTPVRLIVP